MEEDKKKKKNKKKKNKQTVLRTNDTPVDGLVGDSILLGKNHATSTAQVDAASAVDLHLDAQVHLPEEDTQAAGLLKKIEELQNEKEAHFQQEASLQEQVSLLEKEKDAHTKKEADLEKIITELQIEKELLMQKESHLEVKIGQLLTEKESWSQKEALFEERIIQLMDEAANLSLKKVGLEEKVKQMEKERDSRVLQEVAELEELRNSLLQENHLLKETISDLQSRSLHLERTAVSSNSSTEIRMYATENGDAASQTKAAHALVEKLIGENAVLVEKANELSVELRSKSLQQEASSTGSFARMEESCQVADSSVGLRLKVGASEMHSTPAFDVVDEASEKVIMSHLTAQALRKFGNNGGRSDENLDANNTVVIPGSTEMVESDEIVQIPLDENERGTTGVEAWSDDDKAEVAFTDAPLIGAPFRLISFVARYVSGADLVERNSVNSGGG